MVKANTHTPELRKGNKSKQAGVTTSTEVNVKFNIKTK